MTFRDSNPDFYPLPAKKEDFDRAAERFADRLFARYRMTKIKSVTFENLWEREDPVVRLPPGVTSRMVHKVTVGVSRAQSLELSSALGLQIGGRNAANLSAQMQQKFGQTVTISESSEVTKELTLTNDLSSGYRLFAIWHPVRQLRIEELSSPLLLWNKVNTTGFICDSSANITSFTLQ
jgi:hypothetical protein